MANNNHFSLTLDTTAPTGSITRPATTGGYEGYINANGNMTITKEDTPAGGAVTLMKVWFNNKSVGSKEDTEYPTNWIAADTSYATTFTTSGAFYYHLVLCDDVGNESVVYNTEVINYDSIAPTISDGYVEDPDSGSHIITKNTTGNKISFKYADNLAGVVSGRIISEDLVNEITLTLDPTKEAYEGTFDFKDDVEDGTKTLTVFVKDRAGNESVATNISITLDSHLDRPVLVLQKADAQTILPTYINYLPIKANLTVPSGEGQEQDIVGYKIWEGSTEPTDWVTQEAGELNVTVDLSLSDSEGLKNIHAKVKDAAGNIAEAETKTVTVDRVNPTASIERSGAEWISNISGYNSSEIKFSCADASAGVKEYKVYCNGVQIATGVSAETNKTITITSATSGMIEGANKFKISVWDNADYTANPNTYTTSEVIINLDTTAPTVILPALKTWYNAKFDITGITVSDGNGIGVEKMYVWTDTVAIPSVPAIQDPEWTTFSSSVLQSNIHWNLSQSKANYLHIAVKDTVGNVSVMTETTGINVPNQKFGYDDVKPGTPSVAWSQSVYSSTTASINITYSDATSGVVYFQMSGGISESSESEWIDIVGTKSVTLTTGDGYKKIKVRTKDEAGNISDWSDEAQCELDTTSPSGTLALYDKDTSSIKATPSNIAEADAYITYSDDSIGEGYYKVWGNFCVYDSSKEDHRGNVLATTEADAEWIKINPEAGKLAFRIPLVCTTGDGQKNISVRLKDNAEHMYPASGEAALTANFVYDTAAPEVTVSNPDYNRISKVDTVRYSGTAALTAKCNEIKFSFHIGEEGSTETFKAYKVVAYLDQAAAENGTHEDAAVPTVGGSTNMSADGISQSGIVNCVLKGADFESALNGGKGEVTDHSFDGSHFIVVYVQDAAGTWSEAASFTA